MRYRSKPTEIEAEQFDPQRATPFIQEAVTRNHSGAYFVMTKQGQVVYVSKGEFIIKEPDGSGYYPCDPTIFAKRYEMIPEQEAATPPKS